LYILLIKCRKIEEIEENQGAGKWKLKAFFSEKETFIEKMIKITGVTQ